MVLSSHVFCRPQIRTVLARLAKDAGLKSQVLIRPVRTCWNTVTHSLGRALDMQDVLEALCDMHQFNQPGGVRLRRFILSGDEWTILRQLYNLLFVSSSLVAAVISADCSHHTLAIPVRYEQDVHQQARPRPRGHPIHGHPHRAPRQVQGRRRAQASGSGSCCERHRGHQPILFKDRPQYCVPHRDAYVFFSMLCIAC